MEPNLSIRKKKKKKNVLPREIPVVVTPNLQTLDLKNQLPFVLLRGHLGSD